jgi:hypothetical protein
MSPLFNVSLDSFAGLDLRDAVDEGGGAIDLLNVELDRSGRLRSRDGYRKVTASAGATRYDSVYPVAAAVPVSSVTASAGTMADDNSHGTIAWSPSSLPATVSFNATSQVSHYLKATNFGFSVPSTATILGVVATFTRQANDPGAKVADQSVKLLKAGSVAGTDQSAGATWPGSSAASTFGGSTSLWGTTLTPTNVNGSTFGVVLAATSLVSLVTATVTAITIIVYYQVTGQLFVAGAAASRLDLVAVDGTVTTTVSTGSDTQSSYVAFGSPTTSATYIANSGTTIRKLAGTTFSTPSGMPKAKYVGLQTPDNRLVAANVNVIPTGAGSTASTSLVHFSDAGTPETWSANNYVYLIPGDNEDIQGVAVWRNQLFIFKSTKFFVFYGNSTDSTGNPVFNYRRVDGAGLAAPQAIGVSPDGVYFLDRRGIYFTTGGPAARVSTLMDPLFIGGASAFYQAGAINPSALATSSMCWYNGRLYTGLPLGTSTANDHTLVFDPPSGNWMLWDIPMGAMAASLTQPGVLLFTYATGTNDVGQYAPNSYTDDAGTAITARYRSAQIPLDWRGRNLRSGIHGVDKIIRESMVDGSGTISYTIGNQWTQPASLPTARTLTLGTAPQIQQARDRTAIKGRAFSWQISGTAPWSVEKVVWGIHGYEPAGAQGDEGH